MRPNSEHVRVLQLHKLGLNSCEIARRTGIPRATLREWIAPGYVAKTIKNAGCFRCEEGHLVFTTDYAYLLGAYLGDGCLSARPRGVWTLRLFQDQRYVDLIRLWTEVIVSVSGRRVNLVRQTGCVGLVSSWKHWVHLFPQHGPGLKHRRRIVLEPWQREMIAECPQAFIAGLIHSDGCRSINRITRHWGTTVRSYEYPRYLFTNVSDDIRRLFIDVCDLLDVRWTVTNAQTIAVSRKEDVAFLDTFIGPKS